jgi:hypothetical protein
MHRARDQKMFWDQKYPQAIKKNDVYMILCVNKIIYHVVYIYILYLYIYIYIISIYIYIIELLVYIERERERYTHI